jgi:hypothetical protein
VETATQTLHRLTSYQPGRDWDEAIDDPRIVQDLEANDMSRLPWFIKQYAERAAVTPLPRELPVTTEPAVATLTGADRVHEFPVAVVALGDAPPALGAAGPAARGDTDAAPLEFPLVTAAQQAGESDRLGPAWDRGRPVRVPGVAGPPVESVIAARGSQRRMDASRGLSQDVLRTCMSVAVRGLGCTWPPTRWAPAHPG